MKILFAGGGTLGPVSPLLAVADVWKKKDPTVSFVWVGTVKGPERAFIEREGIRFFSIATARFPRYFSMEWILFPFYFFYACLQSFFILICEQPAWICAAGGYTSVPIVLLGRLLGIPAWIHQSDVIPALTNRLLAPFASVITVAWEQTQNAFPKSKTRVVGNPVRSIILSGSQLHAQQWMNFKVKKPVVFIFGGGTGSKWLNQTVLEIKNKLCEMANVIHVTGNRKKKSMNNISVEDKESYCVRELLNSEEMADALAITDVVVCRAGTGTITEIAACKKAAIVIPLPNSAQKQNALMIQAGVIVCDQEKISSEELLNEIRLLLLDDAKRKKLGENLSGLLSTNGAERIIGFLLAQKKTDT